MADDPRQGLKSGAGQQPAWSGLDLALYLLVVLVWGTSWIGIRLQAGPVAPEVSVLWRFLLAAPIMFVWAAIARQPLSFPWRAHAYFAAMGVTMFSTNLILFYHASQSVTSGLIAVVFSLASIFNGVLGWVFLAQRLDRAIVLAAAVGFAGVAAMFAPEITAHSLGRTALVGLAQSVVATGCFCLGNIVSAASQREGLPVLASTAWGMSYGILALAGVAIVSGHEFTIDHSPVYLASLVWLAIASSVVAFAAYLTLVGRAGPARAGYMTILFPVVALLVSWAFEGYRFTPLAMVGLALVVAGNVLLLRRSSQRP